MVDFFFCSSLNILTVTETSLKDMVTELSWYWNLSSTPDYNCFLQYLFFYFLFTNCSFLIMFLRNKLTLALWPECEFHQCDWKYLHKQRLSTPLRFSRHKPVLIISHKYLCIKLASIWNPLLKHRLQSLECVHELSTTHQ